MRTKSAVGLLVLALVLTLTSFGWAQENQREQRRRFGGPAGGPLGGGPLGRQGGLGMGNLVQGVIVSADADSGKVSVLTLSYRGGEGIHPAALNDAAKQLLARADASKDAIEAATLRAAAKQLENLRGQEHTLMVTPDAIVQTVKLMTAKDISVESRIQFNAEFEEDLPEGQTPAAVTIARLGNMPPMIWTAPREARTGMRRWGPMNRGTFVGQVVSVSPLTVDLGDGNVLTVNLPQGEEVRFLQTRGALLDHLQAGMNVVAFLDRDDSRTISRLYAGQVDLEELGLRFLGGFGGGRGDGGRQQRGR